LVHLCRSSYSASSFFRNFWHTRISGTFGE